MPTTVGQAIDHAMPAVMSTTETECKYTVYHQLACASQRMTRHGQQHGNIILMPDENASARMTFWVLVIEVTTQTQRRKVLARSIAVVFTHTHFLA